MLKEMDHQGVNSDPKKKRTFLIRAGVIIAIIAGVVTVVGAATGGFLLVGLGPAAIGFTAVGPAVGSLAASWMSSIGVVQAGSLYSVVQSIAMGGAFAGIVQSGVAAVLGALASLGLVRKRFASGRSSSNKVSK